MKNRNDSLMKKILSVSLLFFSVVIFAAEPLPEDINWVSMTTLHGTSGDVNAIVTHNNMVYIAGDFSTAGNMIVQNGVARWDGSSWSKLGSNVTAPLAFDSAGGLYGVSLNQIVRWDGVNWNPVGGSANTNNSIDDIVFDSSGNLYAAGSFTSMGGVANTKGIAKWNGSNWSALGTGMGGCVAGNGCVLTIAFDSSGKLYAGGRFTTAGGTTASNVAVWNGSRWNAVGSGTNGQVRAMVADNNGNIYIGGSFALAGGVANTNCIAKWNGSVWSALGTGVNNTVDSLAIDINRNVYAGGRFTNASGVSVGKIAKWTVSTSSWSALGDGITGTWVNALATDDTGNLYAGGLFGIAGEISAQNIARWNGTNWQALTIPGTTITANVEALATDNKGNLYIGGQFSSVKDIPNTACVAKWNGTVWSALGDGISDCKYISTMVVDGDGNLYVAGYVQSVDGVVDANFIAKWDGASWTTLGIGLDDSVSTLAYDKLNGILYAGGYFTAVGGIIVNRIAKWDGSNWSALGTGVNDGEVKSMAVNSLGELYIVGSFTKVGNFTLPYLARWNGISWSTLGTPLSELYSVAIDSVNNVYVTGPVLNIAGVGVNKIAKWNGSTWSRLGVYNVDAYTLMVDNNDNLYAGGFFSFITPNGTLARNIAVWNGTEWRALGSGASGGIAGYGNDGVGTLTMDSSGDLYAAGRFTTAGVKSSIYLAKWLAADNDHDGYGDHGADAFPHDATEWLDTDGDGVGDNSDNCPSNANPDQLNNDADSSGDVCDSDDDNDGVLDINDAFPLDPTESADTDGDGLGNNNDNCSALANIDQLDTDGNGFGDACELTTTGANKADLSGASVALADMNSDGYDDLLIGIPLSDVQDANNKLLNDAGQVVIVSGSDGALLNKFIGKKSHEHFGAAIAVVADTNNDGIPDLIIGNPLASVSVATNQKNELLKNVGNVSLYSGADGSFIQSIANGEKAGDHFGAAIAVDENGNLIVGAPQSGTLKDAGRVTVFNGISDTVLYTRYGTQAGERFGSAVAVNTVDNRMLIGSPGFDIALPKKIKDVGRVQIFDSTDLTGLSGAVFSKIGTTAGDRFGSALSSFNQDIDGDTDIDWVVGIPGADILNNITLKLMKDVGKVQIFSGLNTTAVTNIDGATQGDNFGAALGSGADVNNDGDNDLAIGAPKFDTSLLKDAGRVEMLSGAELF